MITLAVRPDLSSVDARRSLASWLRADDRLRDGVTLTPPEGVPEGGADVLRVAVEGAGAAMVLVQAVAGWLTHRRDDVSVGFSRGDGWSADLDVSRARDMTQVTALIEATVHAVTPQEQRP
ncbi:effector-associated constant component EACC1 [Micromonospora sp. DT4]|uniref:effector-associated constant component EACC1 n=1 Tax=Micromonospora sp. DT4 TaxID=3393438 RepID=UPI003CEF0F69